MHAGPTVPPELEPPELPDEPELPELPLEPELPDEPELPLEPLEPLLPLDPELPLDPLEPVSGVPLSTSLGAVFGGSLLDVEDASGGSVAVASAVVRPRSS